MEKNSKVSSKKNNYKNNTNKNNFNKKNINNNNNNNQNKKFEKKPQKTQKNKKNQNSYFKDKYEKHFGNNTLERLVSIKKEIFKKQYIRINESKISRNDVEEFFKKNRVKFKKSLFENSIDIEKSFFNISSSLLSLTGKIYIQDIASQSPISIFFENFERFNFDKSKRLNVLDMCASPGSKTSQVIDLLEKNNIEYEINALEADNKRLQRLINNLQKQEFFKINIFNCKGEEFESKDKFDVIILDAPCSGNLIDDNNWLEKRDEKGILEKSNIQKKLLEKAKRLLSEKGVIIYSTCSIEFEENEENILWAEKNLKLKSLEIKNKLNFETDSKKIFKDKKIIEKIKNVNSIRFFPIISKTQGFFICFLKNE